MFDDFFRDLLGCRDTFNERRTSLLRHATVHLPEPDERRAEKVFKIVADCIARDSLVEAILLPGDLSPNAADTEDLEAGRRGFSYSFFFGGASDDMAAFKLAAHEAMSLADRLWIDPPAFPTLVYRDGDDRDRIVHHAWAAAVEFHAIRFRLLTAPAFSECLATNDLHFDFLADGTFKTAIKRADAKALNAASGNLLTVSRPLFRTSIAVLESVKVLVERQIAKATPSEAVLPLGGENTVPIVAEMTSPNDNCGLLEGVAKPSTTSTKEAGNVVDAISKGEGAKRTIKSARALIRSGDLKIGEWTTAEMTLEALAKCIDVQDVRTAKRRLMKSGLWEGSRQGWLVQLDTLPPLHAERIRKEHLNWVVERD